MMAWLGVFVTAAFLRFDDLAKRPFHADEATGAQFTAMRMSGEGGRFDPKHYHGPLLSDLGAVACGIRGQTEWSGMQKSTLRWVVALAGLWVVMLPCWCRRRLGNGVALMAAAWLATSPLLVYYSRMYIHEMLLVATGVTALACFLCRPKWGLPGLVIGLMVATKETVAVSLLAWMIAAVAVVWEQRDGIDMNHWRALWSRWKWQLLLSMVVALLVACAFYTEGFRYWQGAVDAVKTYFVYRTVDGHEKPVWYYADLMLWPHRAAGVWWTGLPVAVLAGVSYAFSFRMTKDDPRRRWIRFLAYSALVHAVVYALIRYKTPWLACMPWAHVCLLAGFSVVKVGGQRRPWVQAALLGIVGLSLVSQFRQSYVAILDPRNPYAYVPTSAQMDELEVWLMRMKSTEGMPAIDGIAVVGSGFWPLPWYLRAFGKVTYGDVPPDGVERMPLVFAMPESAALMNDRLAGSHFAVLRGLRTNVPLSVYVRTDLWECWNNTRP